MKVIKLNIKQKNKNYPIIIGSNIISKFSNYLKKYNLNKSKFFLVIDKNVPRNMIKILINSIKKKG